MNEKPTFEAMPQIMARLEEKVDALTETVGKLLQSKKAAPAVVTPEEMVTIKEAAVILKLSVSRIYALVQAGMVPCYRPGEGKRKGQPSIDEQMAQLTKGMRNSAKDRRFI